MIALTSTPRFSRSLMTSFLADGIWLSLILRHSSVNAPAVIVSFSPQRSVGIEVILNNVGSDGRLEHCWKRVSLSAGITRCCSNRDSRASRHIGGYGLRRDLVVCLTKARVCRLNEFVGFRLFDQCAWALQPCEAEIASHARKLSGSFGSQQRFVE